MPEEQFASCYHRRTAAKTLENLLKLLLPKYSKNFATIRALIWVFPAGGWDGALYCAGVFTGKIKTSVCKFDKGKSFVGERGFNAEE